MNQHPADDPLGAGSKLGEKVILLLAGDNKKTYFPQKEVRGLKI